MVTQGLVAANARLAKEGLTIPRLELVAGHTAANLLTNVRDALIWFPVKSLYAWLDSTVALHWIRGSGEYKQFVSNRVHKIREKTGITRRHILSQENPSHLTSRGGLVKEDNSLIIPLAHIESGGVGRTIPAQQQIPKKSENQRSIDYRGN